MRVQYALAGDTCSKVGTGDLKANPYYNVKVYDKVQKKANGTFCQQTWTTNGGCCSSKDASQFAQNWLKAVKKNANATKEIMPIFKSSLEYLGAIKAYAQKNKATIVRKGEMTSKQFEDFNLQIQNYIEGIHFFSSKEEAYNNTLEDCYKSIYNMRANGVCLRCSGDFDSFYDTSHKSIKVDDSTCKQLVGNCTDVFAYNAEINSYYRRLQ